MQTLKAEPAGSTSEQQMAREEARIGRVVWLSRVIVLALTAGAVAVFLLTAAERPWQYVAYPLLAGVPLLYGVVSAARIRIMHVDLLRRYQARLLMRTAELQDMASRDELTQLYNRRHFYEFLAAELGRARATKEPMALVLLDIDGLKGINDEYGHRVGDKVIASLARVIARHTRNTDVAARLGGDEFGVVMPETDKRGAFALAQRLWSDLAGGPMWEEDGKRVLVNISIGVSGFPWGGEDVDEMIQWADADMYANKVSRRLPSAAAAAAERSGNGEAEDFLPEY